MGSFCVGRKVEWFRRRGFAISDGWRDVWAAQHADVFTVARMSSHDLLADTRRIIDRGPAEGMATDRIAAGLEERLRGAGWWGSKDGVLLGSPYRVRTILRTNIQTAYSAGRYRRQRETVSDLPYWRYSAILDSKTRPSHAELDGVVYRADNPIWQTIYPPNGFNCRCSVRALTEREVRNRGLRVLEGTDAPFGFTPDEGWDYNPGESAWPVG